MRVGLLLVPLLLSGSTCSIFSPLVPLVLSTQQTRLVLLLILPLWKQMQEPRLHRLSGNRSGTSSHPPCKEQQYLTKDHVRLPNIAGLPHTELTSLPVCSSETEPTAFSPLPLLDASHCKFNIYWPLKYTANLAHSHVRLLYSVRTPLLNPIVTHRSSHDNVCLCFYSIGKLFDFTFAQYKFHAFIIPPPPKQ